MNQGQVAVSAEGLRADGRRETELRKIVCRVGGLPGDGSAFFMLGNTHVVASVFGPHEQRGGGRPSEQCVVNVEVSVAAFAGQERKAPIRRDKRSAETAMLLEQVFEKVRSILDGFFFSFLYFLGD
jgi:exosome complex component RRP41